MYAYALSFDYGFVVHEPVSTLVGISSRSDFAKCITALETIAGVVSYQSRVFSQNWRGRLPRDLS
jgi:hypothetical protein